MLRQNYTSETSTRRVSFRRVATRHNTAPSCIIYECSLTLGKPLLCACNPRTSTIHHPPVRPSARSPALSLRRRDFLLELSAEWDRRMIYEVRLNRRLKTRPIPKGFFRRGRRCLVARYNRAKMKKYDKTHQIRKRRELREDKGQFSLDDWIRKEEDIFIHVFTNERYERVTYLNSFGDEKLKRFSASPQLSGLSL